VRRLLATLLLPIFLVCASCDKLPEGFGRRPYINISPKAEWTEDERQVLAALAKSHPKIAQKIIGRNNELAEAIKAYNEKANEFNRKLLQNIGYSDEEARRMEPLPESP
jgi:hypothetical protein